jgi:uncharacterized CHY-type Zn-finger protein
VPSQSELSVPIADGTSGTARSSTRSVQSHKPARAPIAASSSSSSSSRVVERPVPRAQREDPRGFQIEQLRRRFSPLDNTQQDGENVLKFKLAPSDPDFPFEIAALECVLRVPAGYGKSATGKGSAPKLRIANSDIPRGFQINVERGFDELVENHPQATLLQHLNSLDRELESLLAAPKAETIKIVANRSVREQTPLVRQPEQFISGTLDSASKLPSIVPPTYSQEEKDQAKAKRDADVRQLEARMSRLPLYFRSSDGLVYTLPIEPRRRAELPPDLRAIKTIRLVVPELYNLVPCRIELPGLSGDHVTAVQQNFEASVKATPDISLFAHVNRLAQNIHLMLATDQPASEKDSAETTKEPQPTTDPDQWEVIEKPPAGDKSHVVVIPRPPEWDFVDAESSEESDFDSEELTSDDAPEEETAEDTAEDTAEKPTATGPERGIMISFPHLELHSIELLELITLSLTVKCNRCKEQTDVTNIKNSSEDHAAVKTVSCRKCANQLSVGYRMDLMHAHCIRAGYLDMDGCSVVDLLPSYFLPTCTECSTPVPQPGVVSVRGESTMAICRECHKRISFRIPEIKFLQVSTAAVKATQGLARKRKENLGIKAGEQLPNKGRCSHYAKSYRWFRFSCCSKVFPCDKCHDLASDHPNEHANRMICGYCSREQIYRPESCGVCRASLIAKKGTGFWEGGKGTRDQVKMSRKDPRKFKRRGGNAPVGGK